MSLVAALAALLMSLPGAEHASAATARPAPLPPPYAGVYQPHGADEIGLWAEDDERERSLAESPLRIRDAALDAYVKQVLCSAIGTDRCAAARIYVVRVPAFNASMSANGTLTVYSGLLLRMRDEAELASVLGHEFGHFERRHMLETFKAWRKGSDLLSWAAVLAATGGTRQGYGAFGDLRWSVLGHLSRFSRDHEREADLLSLGYLNASHLRPQAASRVWRTMIREVEASAAARGLRKPDVNHIAFLASHPSDGERANYLYRLAAPEGADRDEGAERYTKALAKWLPTFLDDQIKLNDFGASDFVINRLAEGGWTATLWRARGDLFRTRGTPRDLMNAADFYANALALDHDLAEAQRGLGLALIKTGRAGEGRAALLRYLELRPDAADAAMIRLTLSSIGA